MANLCKWCSEANGRRRENAAPWLPTTSASAISNASWLSGGSRSRIKRISRSTFCISACWVEISISKRSLPGAVSNLVFLCLLGPSWGQTKRQTGITTGPYLWNFKICHLQPSRAVSSQEFSIGDAVSLEPSSNDCVVPSCFHPPVPGVQLSCSGASPLRLKSSCWPPFGHQLWRERSWPCRMQRTPTIANPFRILGASDMCVGIKLHKTCLNSTISVS